MILKPVHSLKRNIQKAHLVLKHQGIKTVVYKTKRYLLKQIIKSYSTNPISDKDYQRWFADDLKRRKKEVSQIELKTNPKISVLMPTYNPVDEELRAAIDSVINQIYTNWELCIADDASTKTTTREILKEYAQKDPRIKVKYRHKNGGISLASNDIIDMVTGDYVALMDNDDVITEDALFYVAKNIEENPDATYIYCDEDLLSAEGQHIKPNFKTDWSPYLIEQTMFALHMQVFKKDIIQKLKFRDEAKGTQDWDLLLRATSLPGFKAIHIPHILYSWRLSATSASVTIMSKPYVIENQKFTVKDYLKKNNIDAELLTTDIDGIYRIKRKINGNPKITVIIPTKDKVELLRDSVDSVLNASYKNTELIIVSNNSKEKETFEYLENLKQKDIKIIFHDHKFNFSELNNIAAEQATGEFLLFLNNDVKKINEDWIEAMLEYAQLPDVGVVGAKLIFGNNTVQHAGIVYGTDIMMTNVMTGFPSSAPGYNFYLKVARDYSAVIGACLLIKKKDFFDVGQFDLEMGLINQEVDLCFKLIEKKKHVIFTPHAQLYHFESATRGKDPVSDEWLRNHKFFEDKWKDKLSKPDPFYNPNLSKVRSDFGLDMSILKK